MDDNDDAEPFVNAQTSSRLYPRKGIERRGSQAPMDRVSLQVNQGERSVNNAPIAPSLADASLSIDKDKAQGSQKRCLHELPEASTDDLDGDSTAPNVTHLSLLLKLPSGCCNFTLVLLALIGTYVWRFSWTARSFTESTQDTAVLLILGIAGVTVVAMSSCAALPLMKVISGRKSIDRDTPEREPPKIKYSLALPEDGGQSESPFVALQELTYESAAGRHLEDHDARGKDVGFAPETRPLALCHIFHWIVNRATGKRLLFTGLHAIRSLKLSLGSLGILGCRFTVYVLYKRLCLAETGKDWQERWSELEDEWRKCLLALLTVTACIILAKFYLDTFADRTSLDSGDLVAYCLASSFAIVAFGMIVAGWFLADLGGASAAKPKVCTITSFGARYYILTLAIHSALLHLSLFVLGMCFPNMSWPMAGLVLVPEVAVILWWDATLVDQLARPLLSLESVIPDASTSASKVATTATAVQQSPATLHDDIDNASAVCI
ncbi:hypothetical protein PENSPDRAFT_672128 [Peniophora sp. CONT]|nr:hypothetical protein PENSPDRAFT_672128 [Peniophora sp. CONT]